MTSASLTPHGVAISTRDGWRSLEHRVLNRRLPGTRTLHGRRLRTTGRVRDAIETQRVNSRPVLLSLVAQVATLGLLALAVMDLVFDVAPLHAAALIAAVLLAGAAALLSVAA